MGDPLLAHDNSVLHTAGIDALVRRCPNLECCSSGLQPGSQLTALRELQQLTSLTVQNARGDDQGQHSAGELDADNNSAVLGGLHTVTGLEELRVLGATGVLKKQQLLPLTLSAAFELVMSKLSPAAAFELVMSKHTHLLWASVPVAGKSVLTHSLPGCQARV